MNAGGASTLPAGDTHVLNAGELNNLKAGAGDTLIRDSV